MRKRVRNEKILLTDFYRDVMKITNTDLLQKCVDASHIERLKASQVLFEEGSVPTKLCFVWDGVLRGFSTSDSGKDITDCISFRRGESTMPEARFDQPASVTIEAVVKSEVVCIPIQTVQSLLENYPELYVIYGQYLLQSANFHRELKTAVYKYAAQERYEWFLQAYPGLIDRIPHKYIASLLNMTTVTLSNARRELKRQEQAL